jgi:2-dehydro-3-deoxyphosphogluconate aldolase / (4S)-4-hydroxy-2-oxoglutarate aldolase
MDRNDSILQLIRKQRLLPLFYHGDPVVCVETTNALYRAGIRVIEFTNRGEAALPNFKTLIAARNESMKDLVVGVGTIRTAEQSTRFIDAGADFLVSPVFDTDVCDAAYINKVLWIPGCMTPTEIHVAERAGCKLVKLFPGNVLGNAFVSGIKELFPKLEFMPTGGVDRSRENITGWFNAGVVAVGMGSKLISNHLLEQKDYIRIENDTKAVLELIQSVKK